MSKKETNETRPQEIKVPKTVDKTVAVLSVLVSALGTLVITTISCWFLFTNIHTDARANVIQDMQVVSKTVEQQK